MYIEDCRNIDKRFNLIHLPGISHLITTTKVKKTDVRKLLGQYKLLNKPAAGIITYTIRKKYILIRPLVWVRLTKTIYSETACASGSLAVVVALLKVIKINIFYIRQPSGFTLTVTQNKKNLFLSGPIIDMQKMNI
ncbi:MAG: hypothetical protein KAZ30_03365 [Candidatus Magasanikbacteria bacterium]|nr:hypothetical protein [Candidatus Magasanikbacteria bacterium]